MNRRDMLKYTALLTGSAVSGSFASAFLSGCSRPEATETELHFFDPDQFERVTQLADTILPRTDSPSATDVGVHHTIDTMIGLVFDLEFKNEFRFRWADFEKFLSGHDFGNLDQPGRVELLRDLELNRIRETEHARKAYVELKQQVIAYYLTKEEIGREHLNYLPVPIHYDPCISVDEVDNRAWAIR